MKDIWDLSLVFEKHMMQIEWEALSVSESGVMICKKKGTMRMHRPGPIPVSVLTAKRG
jgi:hypothetical protein